MRARIYQQPKTAMQSGTAGTQDWVLAYRARGGPAQRPADGLGRQRRHAARRSRCASTRVRRRSPIAERNGIPYDIELPPVPPIQPKAYADNFSYGRAENWTH